MSTVLETCALDAALGRPVPCPRTACAFWDGDGCVIAAARIDFELNGDLADSLFALRDKLELARLSAAAAAYTCSSLSSPSASA